MFIIFVCILFYLFFLIFFNIVSNIHSSCIYLRLIVVLMIPWHWVFFVFCLSGFRNFPQVRSDIILYRVWPDFLGIESAKENPGVIVTKIFEIWIRICLSYKFGIFCELYGFKNFIILKTKLKFFYFLFNSHTELFKVSSS